MTALARIDFALDVLDHFVNGVAWYARQKKCRYVMSRAPWVVFPDLFRGAVKRVRDKEEFRRWKVRVNFLFRAGQWQAAMSEVADAFKSFESDVERFQAELEPHGGQNQ